jgi:lipopolysaccharide/colanic/teichoic acid biosynthesis glycosyltransferase
MSRAFIGVHSGGRGNFHRRRGCNTRTQNTERRFRGCFLGPGRHRSSCGGREAVEPAREALRQSFNEHKAKGTPVSKVLGRTWIRNRRMWSPICRWLKSTAFQETVKRAFDICGAITAILLLSPLIVMVFLLATLTSERPLLCRVKRYNLNDGAFDVWQFRSAIIGPEEGSSLSGQILHRADINEVLLFLNVLRGDMSLVGPYPRTTPSSKSYGTRFAADDRVGVKPGLVSWAQICAQSDTASEAAAQSRATTGKAGWGKHEDRA